MRVVVTGAYGFLGSAVLSRLTETGFDCVGISRREVPGLLRVARYADAPAGDVLIQLAEINDRMRANLLSTEYEQEASNTLHSLLEKGYEKVIYASSAVLYGDGICTPHVETDPVSAIDTYTRVKLAAEHSVLSRGGLVVRFANVYGPRMAAGNVLSHILGQLDRGGMITLQDTTPVRDFLWVEDAADAVVKMVEAPNKGLFNVGTGIGTSILELAKELLDKVDQTERLIVSMQSATKPSCIVLDVKKIANELHWQPSVPLYEGLQRLVSAYTEAKHT